MRDGLKAILKGGTFRVYEISSDGTRLHYTLAGRFKISSGSIFLKDPSPLLAEHLGNGPLTARKRFFLRSLLRASYRVVIREKPGVAYLPSYARSA